MEAPLTIADQGFFFVGSTRRRQPYGTVVAGQMHVQYQVPAELRHPHPLVLVHGGGGQALDFLGTPDGRPGWATLFLREGYAVYVVDRPGMGRSPYHADLNGPASPPPTYEGMVARFAAPSPAHTQWPGSGELGDEALDQFLAGQEPLVGDMASAQAAVRLAGAELLDRIGRAILVTHSLGGPAGWLMADARPGLVEAIVAVEPVGPPYADLGPLGTLACGLTAVPVALERLRDVRVGVVTAEASGHEEADAAVVAHLAEAGVPAQHVRLAELGIRGNGHLMMLERNSGEIARVICRWLQEGRRDG